VIEDHFLVDVVERHGALSGREIDLS